MRCKIKICCMGSVEEAKTAILLGADAVGLVGKMPGGPGPIPDWLIAEIARSVPPPVASFLLTSEQSSEGIIHHIKRTDTTVVQIVDELVSGTYSDIRSSLPNVKIVQVIHVADENSIEEASRIQDEVDAILLDSGSPRAPIKTLGGTGIVHNWEISREIVKTLTKPVFLAGGLNASNVQTAIRKVKPYGVDVCSGVRTNGKLDRQKAFDFIRAANEA